MANSQVSVPSGFGGLTRFQEEYASKINLKPTHIVVFVILLVALRIGLATFLS